MLIKILIAGFAIFSASTTYAAGIESGLQVGQKANRAFDVVDVTGPAAGKSLCYR